MLSKKWFSPLAKQRISRLRGGPSHNFIYFVGVCESTESDILTDIIKLKLRNQMGSQKSKRFPEGYEPLEGAYGMERLCLTTMTFPIPSLKLMPVGWPSVPRPRIVKNRKLVCVLDPGPSSEAFQILETEAEFFEIKHRIRRHAARNQATLDLIISTMAFSGRIPFLSDPCERFEAYLGLRAPEFLRDLLALLDMPDSPSEPTATQVPKAA